MDTEETIGLTQLTDILFRKMDGFFDATEEIRQTFSELCSDLKEFDAGTALVEQGSQYGDVLLLERGWVLRSRLMENGARQIVNVALPGDFIAMNALLFSSSDFELRCKTDIAAFAFPAERLGAALASDAMMAAALFWVNAHEESLLAERIVSLGRRSARQRTAHVLCELVARMEIIGVVETSQFIIPISQEEFSDILGISVVHMNKTLRALERDGIISFRNALLMIRDRARLEAEAGFDNGYIQFSRREDRNAWRLASMRL